jgi:tetratricopeptide repeat protein
MTRTVKDRELVADGDFLLFLSRFGIVVPTMLADIWQSIPQIIKEAATSPSGVLALMIIALAILAFFFFKEASVQVRVIIFVLLFSGVVVFAYKVRDVASGKPASTLTPSSSSSTLDENAEEPTPRPGSAEDLEQIEIQINTLQMQGLAELYDDSAGTNRLGNASRTFEAADTLLSQAEKNFAGDVRLLELRGYMWKDFAMLSRELSKKEEVEGYLKKAEQDFNAVLKRRPSPSAYNGLGSVYLLRGDIDRAEKEIQSALKLEPDYGPAKADLQQIEALKKQKKRR